MATVLATPAHHTVAFVENNEELNAKLEEFDLEVETRCEEIRTMARTMKIKTDCTFGVELMKIPKKIRDMSMQEFLAKCAPETADASIMQVGHVLSMADAIAPSTVVPATSQRASRASAHTIVAETPATSFRKPKRAKMSGIEEEGASEATAPTASTIATTAAVIPSTDVRKSTRSKVVAATPATGFRRPTRQSSVQDFNEFKTPMPTQNGGKISDAAQLGMRTPFLRTVKRGETIVSANGSPLALDASVVRASVSTSLDDSMAVITVPIANGKAVEISHPDEVKDITGVLSKGEKQAMVQKLQDLSNHIAALMKGLKSTA